MIYFAEGSPTTAIDSAQARLLVEGLLAELARRGGPLKKVLLVPPDATRLHSGAGELAVMIFQALGESAEIVVLPALGTHFEMEPAELAHMFPGIPLSHFRPHDWRNGTRTLGTLPGQFIGELSEGKVDYDVQVAANRLYFEEPWDAVISIGQLVPHEVCGIANGSKNILVGTGGKDFISKSHFLGAVHGMERLMGKPLNPVRSLFNAAAEFLKDLPITYLLTVRAKDSSGTLVTRGLFAGDGIDVFNRGSELCREVNLTVMDREPKRVVVYLDPAEFRSTWLGNKAVYRTRMAIADGGELIVLAPGVKQFGEDPAVDKLIRKHGYFGTPKTLAAVKADPELADNLSAAAHLIHGSSEGRFQIRYCPGHLTHAEVEGVGYEYGDLASTMAKYDPVLLIDGWNDVGGDEIFYISNPALGLWGTPSRFGV